MTTGRINQVTNQTLPRHKKRPGAPVTLDSHPGASEHQAPVKHALIRGCCGAATRHDCQGTNNQPHTKLHTTKRNSTQTGTDNTTGRKSRCRQLRPPKNRYIEGVAEAMPPKRLVPQGLNQFKTSANEQSKHVPSRGHSQPANERNRYPLQAGGIMGQQVPAITTHRRNATAIHPIQQPLFTKANAE